jgi:hypothetical protein
MVRINAVAREHDPNAGEDNLLAVQGSLVT